MNNFVYDKKWDCIFDKDRIVVYADVTSRVGDLLPNYMNAFEKAQVRAKQAESRAIELETQLVPLQQQFDDWAEQNRRARAWAAAWKRKAKEFRDWYFYAEKHIFRSQELSQRVKELEADNARLRAALATAEATKSRILGGGEDWREFAERKIAENTSLRAALEAVEWIGTLANLEHLKRCPWCYNRLMDGHASDCKRQQALEGAQ